MNYLKDSAFFFSGNGDRYRFSRRMAIPGFRFSAWLLLVAPLCLAVGYIGMAHGFHGEGTRQLFSGLRSGYPALTALMGFLSDYGPVVIYLGYAAVLAHALIVKNRCNQVFCFRFVAGLALVFLLVGLLKGVLGMPRPGIPFPPAPFSFAYQFESFPSGHTAQAVAQALPLVFYFRRRWMYAVMPLVMLFAGMARLWLGMHHPVDVLGGVFFGSLILLFMFRKARGGI